MKLDFVLSLSPVAIWAMTESPECLKVSADIHINALRSFVVQNVSRPAFPYTATHGSCRLRYFIAVYCRRGRCGCQAAGRGNKPTSHPDCRAVSCPELQSIGIEVVRPSSIAIPSHILHFATARMQAGLQLHSRTLLDYKIASSDDVNDYVHARLEHMWYWTHDRLHNRPSYWS